MSGTRQAIALSSAGKYVGLLIQLVSTVVIARLLTPEEIGIYSVGAAVVAVAHILRDFGISSYLIQERELTRDRIGTAFTITLLIGWGLGALVLLGAPLAAGFYEEPGLRGVLAVIAFNFFIIPFGSVSMALLRREMQFGSLFWIGTASTFVQAGVGMSLAWLGFGFMSLAWSGLAGVVATVVGSFIALPRGFLSRPTLSERGRVFAFGSRVGVANIAHEVGHVAPDLILGKILGFSAVGLFNRALGFVQLFERLVTDALRPVLLPHFSRAHREGADLGEAYVCALHYMLGIAWPFVALLALLAAPLIRILYGDQWDAAVPVAHVLCLAVAVRAAGVLTGSVLVAHGAAQTAMIVGLVTAFVKIAAILSLASFGLFAAACGFVLAEVLANLLSIRLASGRLGFDLLRLGPVVVKGAGLAAFVSTFAMLGGMLLGWEIGAELGVVRTAGLLAAGGLGWLAGLYLLRHPLGGEVAGIVRLVLRRIRSE